MSGPEVMRVLVVDDNPDDRQLVRREVVALFPDAEVVELAEEAEVAAALRVEAPPDLVVTDLDLKWGSGREVLARVRAEHPGCPVVMFTNSGDETVAVELMKAGLDDYVVKSARQLPRLRASLKIAVDGARSKAALTQRERQLASALEHQKTLVRELHHRVKNNLQTITSLLQLRARAAEPEAARHLQDLAGRMRALAAVQTRIYETEALDRVDFRQALSDIAESLARIHEEEVGLARDFDGPLELDVARAMPLGLLCYEVILNALKHAWPEGRPGKLVVELRTRGAHPEVRVSDNGVGFDEDGVVQGLGSRLARALSREARVEMSTASRPGEGTTVTLRLL